MHGMRRAAAGVAAACALLAPVAHGYTYQLITDEMRALANTIIAASAVNATAYERLGYMCDTFGPRFSGSQALEDAKAWVTEVATADGFNVTNQPVNITHWVRGNEWAQMIQPRNKTLHFVGLGMSNSSGGGVITAPVLVVTSEADFNNHSAADVAGKIVLFNVPFTTYGETVYYRSAAATLAASRGGVGALIRAVGPYGIQTPHTGSSTPAAVPAGAVSMEDASQMQRMQDRGQQVVVSIYMEAQLQPDSLSSNVIIDLPGSEMPDEYVVMGGHSDSWDIAEGAMDDGGGIVAAWEALRLVSVLGIRPRRTIRVVLWVNEENGAKGGAAYAAGYSHTLNSTSIAMETDEGAFSPWSLAFYGHDAAYNQMLLLAPLLDPLRAGNVSRAGGPPGTDVDATCSSSPNFPCGGLETLDPRATPFSNNPCLPFVGDGGTTPHPLGGIADGYFWFHHTAGDTLDRMDPAQLQTVAATLAVWAVSIANLPALLPRDGPVPPMPQPAPKGADDSGLGAGAAVSIALGVTAAVCLSAVLVLRPSLRHAIAQVLRLRPSGGGGGAAADGAAGAYASIDGVSARGPGGFSIGGGGDKRV